MHYASTFDVTTSSHAEAGSGARNDRPTITAAFGLFTTTEDKLKLAIGYVK